MLPQEISSLPSQQARIEEISLDPERYLTLFERLTLLIDSNDTDEICRRACALIADLLEVFNCSIILHDTCAPGRLRLAAATHIPREEWPSVHIATKTGAIGSVMHNAQSLLIQGAEEFRSWFGRDPDSRYSSPSCVIAPLTIKGELAGVVNVAHPRHERMLQLRDRQLLEAAAKMVGGALTNAIRYNDTLRIHGYLEEMFESLHIGIISVNAEGMVVHCNQRAMTMLNVDPVGHPTELENLLPPYLLYDLREMITRSQVKLGPVQQRVKYQKGESSQTLVLTVNPMRCLGGSRTDSLILVDEVGQEEELQRLREAEQTKRNFLAIISHELRTPLSVIRGSLPLIDPNGNKQIADETLGQVHRLLRKNTHRLTDVVNAILDVTEIESGTLQLSVRTFDLPALLAEVSEFHAESAGARKVTIRASSEIDQLPITADRRRLRQVLLEMVANAVKFSHPDTVIELHLRIAGNWIEIDCENTGVPITADQRMKIFDKFCQGDQTSTRAAGGCGLGLFLMKNIIDLHGGSFILLDGEEGRTTFRIRLPLFPAGEDRLMNLETANGSAAMADARPLRQ